MGRTWIAIALAAIAMTDNAMSQPPAVSPVPADSEIRKILADRIDTYHQNMGIVVGVIEPAGRRLVVYGSLDKNDPRPLNGDTLFEIGSITKVFTSLLLTDMVQRNEVALADPIAKYLPSQVKVPQRGGRSITLADLSLQISGLPRLPDNFSPKDPANPYADYGADRLYEFLDGYQLSRDIGQAWEYSNLGIGLLGHVLELRAGSKYEALVQSRIATPLEMGATRMALTPEMKARLAVGHNGALAAVPNWDFDALAGCGALRSSTNDLLKFLAANLGYTKSPLAPAMKSMLEMRHGTGQDSMSQALGWQVFSKNGRELIWKDGGTYGYSTFIGYDPKNRTGVVVLSNTFTTAGVNDIGLHLLEPSLPLLKLQPKVPKEHKEITIDPALFDRYVGYYEFTPNARMAVTREGEHYYLQLTGQSRAEVFPEGDRDFFYKIVDAQVTFEVNGQGLGSALVLHQEGVDQRARRVSGVPPAGGERKEVPVSPTVLEGYVGRYQLTPGFILTVTRNGNHLHLQATGQPIVEVFAESDHEFYLKVVDAQITFKLDPEGHAVGLVLRQGGINQVARRIE